MSASGLNRRRDMAEEERSNKKKIHAFMRFFADFLTLSRFAIAAFIVVAGIFMGRDGLKVALIATLIGWISDTVDGFFARNSGGRVSRVARYDFPADMCPSHRSLFPGRLGDRSLLYDFSLGPHCGAPGALLGGHQKGPSPGASLLLEGGLSHVYGQMRS